MKEQTKLLKEALETVNATRHGSISISVNTTRNANGELGKAEAHTDALSDTQISKLKKLLPCVEIQDLRKFGFAIVRR